MATTDFRRIPDAQLQVLIDGIRANPDSVPNPTERAALIAEYNRRQVGLPPDAEANLEASATPITPDPVVKPKAAKPKAAAPAPRTGKQRMDDVMAQGQFDSPQRGLRPGQSLEEYGREYRAALEQKRKEELAEVAARRAAGEQDPDQAEYNAETGVLGDTSLPPMDGYNEATKEYSTPRAPLHPMIARDRALEQQHTEQTAAAIGAKYGPEAEALYRDGRRRGVLNFDAVRSPAEKEANARWAQIENDARMSPSLLVREGARQQLRDRAERTRNDPSYVEREIVRWSDATGLPPAQVRQLFAQDRDQARVMLRDAANGRRAADRQAAKDHWRAVAMLAGGSQNLNAGNRAFYNQLAMLPEDQRMQQLQYGLPGGAERAAVDARQLDVAARLAGNAIAGQLGGFAQAANPVVQNQVQQQQLAQQQEAVKWAEDNINENYAWDADSWFESDFTEAERTQAINDLMVRYGPPNGRMTLAEATRIVDNIGARKRRPRAAAPAGGPGDDPGAMPAVSA